MAKRVKIALQDTVAEKYQIANKPISGKFVDPKFGEIDLYELNLKQADALFQRGFPYLMRKTKKA